MTHRTQIILDSELEHRARRKAQAQGISFPEYLRRLLARDLADASPEIPPSVVFDLGESSGAGIARHKDAMIGDAVLAGRKRPRA